jgi:hypothetical protein
MCGRRLSAVALLALGAGCQSSPSPRPIARAEPGLASPSEPDSTVVQTQPPREVTWADRHPLFTKPREYYDSSGDNRVVKAAAATVIGVPAGIIGELRQMVVGAPPQAQSRY